MQIYSNIEYEQKKLFAKYLDKITLVFLSNKKCEKSAHQ